MSDSKPQGDPDPLAGFNIEIHPASLDGLGDVPDQKLKRLRRKIRKSPA
ncbi:hypothetical protein [Nocardia sp. NPDC058666]